MRAQRQNRRYLRKPGYELYYRRLASVVSARIDDNRVVLDLRSFGGITTIQISIHGFSRSVGPNDFEPVCVIEANWQAGAPLRISTDPACSALDLRVLQCSANQLTPRLRRLDGSIVLEANSTEDVNNQQEVTFLLEATNISVPLPERAPLNRSVVGFSVLWLRPTRVGARIELVRNPGSTTCFTKGNYILAFPSRPFDATLKTVILYPNHTNRIQLLYGFVRDPSTVFLRAASMLVISGLGFVAAWLMANAAIPGTPGNLTPYIGLLVTLTLPTLTAFGELAISDRHTLYSRRRDIGFALMGIAIGAGGCGMLAAIYLFVSSGFGTRTAPTIATNISVALLVVAVFLLALGVAVLAAYRSGFIVPYLCDNETCDRRIRWRNRRLDCYTTGRIMCNECEKRLCHGCVGNYWERGASTLIELPSHDTYNCLR